jgi:ubiquinone/menaquinone biosynthesis C-methylase UbiE
MLTPPRLDTPELLDEHDAPVADMERSLRDLRRINRWLGGIAIYKRMLRRHGGAQSVLDLGAGTADLLSSLGSGFRVALDFKIDHLLRIDDRTIRRVVADAHALPFRDRAVDVVTSAHFFHHFTPDENASILREALRVARRGVAVNDTKRSYLPLAFVKLLSWLRLVGRITRFDAPASVRRGYNIAEVREIAQRTGAVRAEVVSAFPYRWGMLLWK